MINYYCVKFAVLKRFVCLQVTPPEEPTPMCGVPCMGSGINPAMGSSLGVNNQNDPMHSSISPEPQQQASPSSQHHLQGTIV